MDAYEAQPQLLAFQKGVTAAREAVVASFEYGGTCRKVLEELENGRISADDAANQISKAMDEVYGRASSKYSTG